MKQGAVKEGQLDLTRAARHVRVVNADLSWLKDNSLDNGELPEPSALAEEAIVELTAIKELRAILLELGEDPGVLEEAGVMA